MKWDYIIYGPPAPKPRMTQRDKWLKPVRPPVAKYRAYKESILLAIPQTVRERAENSDTKVTCVFYIGTNASHLRVDVDNLAKAVLDSVFENDRRVMHIDMRKELCEENPRTELRIEEINRPF